MKKALSKNTKPYFIWDYDLSEKEVRKILKDGSEFDKKWLMARLLEHAHFKDIFRYIKISDLISYFPQLKLRPSTYKYWQRALSVWGYVHETQ